jgi:hypothetical protein
MAAQAAGVKKFLSFIKKYDLEAERVCSAEPRKIQLTLFI